MTGYMCHVDSPLGCIVLTGTRNGLSKMTFQSTSPPARNAPGPGYMQEARKQLLEYLRGERTKFAVPLDIQGTPFQLQVWQALQEIPYGHTASYADIAARIGNPRACRAVGGANNTNPVPIVIPCHRVIGRNGRLVGYGSGVWRKRLLLELEGRTLQQDPGL